MTVEDYLNGCFIYLSDHDEDLKSQMIEDMEGADLAGRIYAHYDPELVAETDAMPTDWDRWVNRRSTK